MVSEVDHYKVLGVAPDATYEQIRAAYRAAVKRYHPDLGGDPDRFREIRRAWEVLGVAESRLRYDIERSIMQGGIPGTANQHRVHRDSPAESFAPRVRHDVEGMARLNALWVELSEMDQELGLLRRQWLRSRSSEESDEVRDRHNQLVEKVTERWISAAGLQQELGADPSEWPHLPNILALAGLGDELGFDATPRVWFVTPGDLLRGPLWLQPSLSLRVRSAAWSALVALGWWARGSVMEPSAPVAGWVREFHLWQVLCVAGVVGAWWWPVLVAVGLGRRVRSRFRGWGPAAATGVVWSALVALDWWWSTPLTAAGLVTAGGLAATALYGGRRLLSKVWKVAVRLLWQRVHGLVPRWAQGVLAGAGFRRWGSRPDR